MTLDAVHSIFVPLCVFLLTDTCVTLPLWTQPVARGAALPARAVTCSTFQLVPSGAALHHWLTEGGAPRAQPLASRRVKLRGIMNTPGLLWDQAEDGAFPEITCMPGFSLSLSGLSTPLLVSPGSTFQRNHLPGNPQVGFCFWDSPHP